MILEAENLNVRFGGVHALNGVDIALKEGEIAVFLGPNGAGKSTLLKAVFGLVPLAAGKVRWLEKRGALKPDRLVRRGIVMLPQGKRIFPRLTVEENLAIVSLVRPRTDDDLSWEKEIRRMFPVLERKAGVLAGRLSGGEQQMVSLARALSLKPAVLLLDEPSLGLAPTVAAEVFAKIKEINTAYGMAVMLVEHTVRLAVEIADTAYVMDKGAIVASGPAREIMAGHSLEKVFFGTV